MVCGRGGSPSGVVIPLVRREREGAGTKLAAVSRVDDAEVALARVGGGAVAQYRSHPIVPPPSCVRTHSTRAAPMRCA
eukprot:scaffold15719_cov146-Isochrysis_galbana.AAC.2